MNEIKPIVFSDTAVLFMRTVLQNSVGRIDKSIDEFCTVKLSDLVDTLMFIKSEIYTVIETLDDAMKKDEKEQR